MSKICIFRRNQQHSTKSHADITYRFLGAIPALQTQTSKGNPLITERLLQSLRRVNKDSRGAVMVETVFVLPILILLTLAIIEFSLYWRSDLSVSQAAKDAARKAVGTGRQASPFSGDAAAMKVIHDLAKSGAIAPVKAVVIYKPEVSVVGGVTKYVMPAGCESGHVLTKCTRYDNASALQLSSADFDTTLFDNDYRLIQQNNGWDPYERCDLYSTASNSQPDLLGVRIETTYTTLTNFPVLNLLDGPQNSSFVLRIEPQNTSVNPC